MKYLILSFLFLFVTSCGTDNKPQTHTQKKQNKTDSPSDKIQTPPKTLSKMATFSAQKDTPSNKVSLSLKEGATNKGQVCTVSFPKEADNLDQFQVSLQITQDDGSLIVQSHITVTVTKDKKQPNTYHSESSPFVNLKFESGNVVYFSTWENTQKKYTCTFN